VEYVPLGLTGLRVSRLCLGAYGFGDPGRGSETWTLPEADSLPIIRQAVEAGINFFDTANSYSAGHSEEILGRGIRQFGRRDEVVIATKVWARVRPGPNGAGLSRKAILTEVDHSLARLGTDYIDLYQIHRWDPVTPIEETMAALHDVVRSGKVRYLGASSMTAWQFAKAQHTADRHGWTRFVSMQNHLNLLYREEEREMLPLCLDQGVGVIPWSPLARGKLARPWHQVTPRATADRYVSSLYQASDQAIVERVGDVAEARGVTRAQVALAWLAAQPAVTAPIIGVTSAQHLTEAIAATDLHLTAGERDALEELYRPRPVDFGQ
jgi:aryl-alcohol dehydrogenase-like predicted oxidoreductase